MSAPAASGVARAGRWRYWGFVAARAIAARLPRGVGYRLGALGGELYFWLNPAHSHKAVTNFAVVLADDPRTSRVRLTARRSFRNYGKYLFDFFRQLSLDPDTIEEDFPVLEGFEHLDAALAAGHGVIFVTPHFGNWDLAGALVATRGYPIVALIDRFTPPALDRLVRFTRQRVGMATVPLEGGSLRRLTWALRRNQVVAIVSDRPQRDGGVPVCFFGEEAWLPTGPARFALRTGATILFGYVGRRPGDRTYFGIIEPPIRCQPSGDAEADIQVITAAIVTRMERLLRQYPDQWYMFRDMWPEAKRAREYGGAATRRAELG